MTHALQEQKAEQDFKLSDSSIRLPLLVFKRRQKVMARQQNHDIWRSATIVDIISNDEKQLYYIHWTNSNRRLDEWLESDRVRSLPPRYRFRTELGTPISNHSPILTRRRSKLIRSLKLIENSTPVRKKVLQPRIVEPQRSSRFENQPKNVSMIHLGSLESTTLVLLALPFFTLLERFSIKQLLRETNSRKYTGV